MLADAIGDQKLRILRPPVTVFREPNFVVTEWLAVGRGGVLLVRRAVADVGSPWAAAVSCLFGEP